LLTPKLRSAVKSLFNLTSLETFAFHRVYEGTSPYCPFADSSFVLALSENALLI